MKIGLHIADFSWPGGPPQLASDLANVVSAAEDAGLARVSVMDHLWQIGHIGPPEHEMLEELRRLADLGIAEAHGMVSEVWSIEPLELLGERVVPVAAEF